MPTISLCMIVKNEEDFLPRCLDSVKDYVDEIIVVDTGSTDRTVEIARSFGARIYHHPWENNFSKHRNQSIGYATGDWVFIMDADEELKQGSGNLIKDAVLEENIDSVMIAVVSCFNNRMSQSITNQVRLFRNKEGIYYSSPVHNQLIGYKSTITYPVYLYHYGYDLSPEKMKAKFIRTSTLLKEMIKKEPERFRHHHNLAVCYNSNNMFKEAAAEGIKAIETAEKEGADSGALVLWSHFITAFAYFKLGDLENAEQYALRGVTNCSEHLDSQFILVLVYHKMKDWKKLKESADRYLRILKILWENPGRFGDIINNTANEEWRVRLALGAVYLEQGEEEKANEQFNKALLITPNYFEYHKILGEVYRNRGLWKKAEESYRNAIMDNPEYPDALFGLALLYKSRGELGQHGEMLDRLSGMEIDDTDVLMEIGIYNLTSGRYESAIRIMERVLDKRPDDVNAHINIALAFKLAGQKEDAVGYNLKALELKSDSLEALTNLGHLYFESARYDLAREMYLKALELESNLIDVHLRLALICVFEGEIENCVARCDSILNVLHLPRNKTLNSTGDLSELFLIIAHTLDQSGKERLSREALAIAVHLTPDIVS